MRRNQLIKILIRELFFRRYGKQKNTNHDVGEKEKL